MKNNSKNDFEQIISYTIRIELKDGTILHYMISPESKKAFENQLLNDAVSVYDKSFLWFYIPEDRLVLINEKDIIRITFCFEAPMSGKAEYFDNFKVLEKFPQENEMEEEEEENEMEDSGSKLDLPELIIKHRREKEDSEIVKGVTMKTEGFYGNVSYYFDMSENQVSGLDFDYYDDEEEWVLLASKYFQFIDEDGEDNFMPHKNLSLIEIKRSFIMPDEQLDLYLGRKTG
jgi:hypothetical protein